MNKVAEKHHAGYPHEAGALYDCPECDRRCYCGKDRDDRWCVWCAEHGDDTPDGQLVRMYFAGFTGDRMQPPEAAEFLIRCDRAGGDECDAYAFWPETPVCRGDADHPEHDVNVDDGNPDE